MLPLDAKPTTLIAARRFVRHSEMPLQLKKQWDITALGKYARHFGWAGLNIPHHLRGQDGRVLSRWGEPVWGALVADGKSLGRFDDKLVGAAVELVTQRWPDAAKARWVTCIPSLRHPELVPDFARRLAEALGLPFREVIRKVRETDPQKQMENRFYQCSNLDGAFAVDPELLLRPGTVSG